MTIQVRRRTLRGVAGAAGLLAAVAGVPIGLMALAQPPPSAPPGWHQVVDALSQPISDSMLLRAAGVVCWLVWAAFVVAVGIEVAGQVVASGDRLRPGVPGLQRAARTLVLTAALLLPQKGTAGAVAAGAPPPRPAAVGAATRPVAAGPAQQRASTTTGTSGAPRSAISGSVVAYVVQHYDSPWAIAERHLGNGTRWRELRDAGGNSLELLPSPGHDSGRASGGARIIQPGEVIFLPVDRPAIGTCAPTGIDRAAAGTGAPAALPAAGRRDPPVPAPRERPGAQPPPGGPNVSAEAGSTGAPAMRAVPLEPAGARGSEPGAPPPEMLRVASARRTAPARPTAGVVLEAGMVATAVLTVVRTLRRRQAQRRPPGRRIRLPGPDLAGSELTMRQFETGDRVALAGAAMDVLAATLRDAGPPEPAVLGVLVDDDAVEVLLDRPVPALAPWTASAEGFRWRIPSATVEIAPARRSSLLPALVSLGRAAAGDADVLINIEAAGVVAIAGPPARAAGVLHAVATQLCGAPWSGAVDVVLVGLDSGLAPLDRVRTAASIAALKDELSATAAIMADTMAANACADPFQGRVRGLAGDGWPPTVVLSAAPMAAEEWAWLSGLARPGSGVAAVVARSAAGGRWVIDAGADPMPVDPLRLAVRPAALDAATMAEIGQLLEIAGDDTGATLAEPPYDHIDVSVDQATLSDRADRPVAAPASSSLAERLERLNGTPGGHGAELPVLPEPEILVRVLGAVDAPGATEFKRAKGRELIVYLAMHPHGVGEAELDEALWPSSEGRVVSAPTRDSTVSAARRAVGGPARLLPAVGQGREKRYRLGPGVQSDWGRFCILHRWGRDRSSTAALRLALETVRGRPFEGVDSGRTYGWIHTEGHGRHIEAEVGDAADLAAGLFLEAGDAVGARWAARQGLMADPYTERLWVRLMQAADVLGESQEIERVMDEMDVVLELEGDFSGLHPHTLAVYQRLSRRHRFPAGR